MNNNDNKWTINKIYHHPIFRFVVIGVVNTVHNMFWYHVFLNILHLQYQLSFGLAFIIAMIGSFFLNTYFTFKTKPTLRKFIKFPITTLPNFIISQFGLKILVAYFGMEPFISGFLSSLISIPITYLVTKFVLTGDDDKNIFLDDEDSHKNLNPEGKVIYNYGTLSKKDRWLTLVDIIFFILIIAFAFLDHGYIFRQGKLFNFTGPVTPTSIAQFIKAIPNSIAEYNKNPYLLYGVTSTDSTTQMIYFLPYIIKDFFLDGNFWSWSYGMGGDIYSEFSYYYTTSPIIWTLIPFFKLIPSLAGKLSTSLVFSLQLKLFISIYKQALLMLFMYILLRYEKRSKLASLAASIVYGGGLYYLWNANYFDFMTDAYLWVPLMVLGFRIYQKKKNIWPLVISAALCAINNYYFAYHTFMFFILFVLIMIVPQGAKFRDKLKSYFSQLGAYGFMGLCALLISQFAFLPAVFSFIKLDRFSNINTVSLLQDSEFYKYMPLRLFFNDSTLGITMLIVLFLFIKYGRSKDLTDRKIILMLVMFVLYCTPYTGYFLNGMNYSSERWFYLLIFAFSYALSDILDEMKRKNNFYIIFFFAICGYIYYLITTNSEFLKDLNHKNIYYMILGANLIAFLLVAIRKYFYRISARKLLDGLIVVAIAVGLLGNAELLGNKEALTMNPNTFVTEKMQSPELDEVMAKVKPRDGEFFRTVFRNNTYENAPTYYRFNGISTFASMTDGPMHDYIKRVLDIRHNIVYLSSFMNMDDRAYLEGLLGVKYIIGDKDAYTPPPIYKKIFSNSKYDLFENQNTVGMDMWFTQTFPSDQIESLKVPDRDLQLLNFAVTDNVIEGINDAKSAVLSEDIPLTEDVMIPENVDIYENAIDFKSGGRVTFKIPNPSDYSQLYLHAYIRPDDRKEFEQKVNEKISFKSYEDNPYVYYTNRWTFALNGSEKELGWSTNSKSYELNEFYLARVDLTSFNEVIKERNKYNMENLVVGKNKVSGTVSNNEKGIMVFNIPYNKGWTLKVNGKKTEIQKMNGFLSGVVLEPGVNNLEFKFVPRGLVLGSIISICTLIGLIILDIFIRRKRKFEVNTSVGPEMTFNYKNLYTEEEENTGIRAILNKKKEGKKLLSLKKKKEVNPIIEESNIENNDSDNDLDLSNTNIYEDGFRSFLNNTVETNSNSTKLDLSDEEKEKYQINSTNLPDEINTHKNIGDENTL